MDIKWKHTVAPRDWSPGPWLCADSEFSWTKYYYCQHTDEFPHLHKMFSRLFKQEHADGCDYLFHCNAFLHHQHVTAKLCQHQSRAGSEQTDGKTNWGWVKRLNEGFYYAVLSSGAVTQCYTELTRHQMAASHKDINATPQRKLKTEKRSQ